VAGNLETHLDQYAHYVVELFGWNDDRLLQDVLDVGLQDFLGEVGVFAFELLLAVQRERT